MHHQKGLKLKDWHGNRTRVSGRHMHKEETREFEWITKLILAANEGKIPVSLSKIKHW